MVTLKYCASGFISFPNLNTIFRNNEGNEYLKYVAESVHKVDEKYKDYNLTLLYNAYTEKDNTPVFKKLLEHGLNVPIYTDSGGLQINLTKTTASTNIEQSKLDVYKEQSILSDYGMCFDEMPVHINDRERPKDAHSRMDASGRYYVLDLVYSKGVQTGKNIKQQIETFKELKSKTKIFLILQGYTLDDYNLYADGVYSQLTEDDYDYIEGVAIANTLTSDYFSAFDTFIRHQHHLNVPEQHKKHIHLLGVGGLNRIFPFLVLKNKETFWEKDFIVNFDSTSATSSFIFGRSSLLKNKRLSTLKLGYQRTNETDFHCQNVYNYSKALINEILPVKCNSVDEFIENYSIFNSQNKRKISDFNEDEKTELCSNLSHNFNSCMNELSVYFDCMHLIETEQAYHLLTNSAYIQCAKLLSKINTIDEYMAVRDDFRKILQSARTSKLNRVQSMSDVDNKNTYLDVFNLF